MAGTGSSRFVYPKVQKDMWRLAGLQLGVTLGALAPGLPIFDVVFRSEREFTVTEVGAVG